MIAPPPPDLAGPGEESVWRYPRPAVVERCAAHLVVKAGGRVLAETRRGWRALETSHPPSYYFPPEDVDMSRLAPAEARSLCEWKGGARYYDLLLPDRRVPEVAWSYPDPTPAFAPIRDHLAFYAGRVDACLVDGELARAQDGGFYGGWITRGIAGPFKGGPGTRGW